MMSGVLATENGKVVGPLETAHSILDDGSGNASISGAATVAGALTVGTSVSANVLALSVTGGAQAMQAMPNAGAGAYNPITQTGDVLVVGAGSVQGAAPLALVPWSGTKSGLRLLPSGEVLSAENTLDDGAGNAAIAGGLTANGIALAVTPSVATLATNPPVSGTAYQWAGPGKLELSCPVTLNPTSSAAATAALNIGPTSTPSNQIDYASRPAGLTAADGEIITLRATIPAGWYYELSATNATIGTCVGVVH